MPSLDGRVSRVSLLPERGAATFTSLDLPVSHVTNREGRFAVNGDINTRHVKETKAFASAGRVSVGRAWPSVL